MSECLTNLKQEYKLIDLFCELVGIPSPSLKEEAVALRVIEILEKNGIAVKQDDYGNIIAKVVATDSSKKPILLSAHMDVVGDSSKIKLELDGEFIQTDKTRTLGADNKAGVAAAMQLAIELVNDKNLKHGGCELVFTRDEEHTLTGIKNVDMRSLESEYILVLDADKLGDILVSGASFTKLILLVDTFLGGHSGLDIADTHRLNAVKLLAELVCAIPQGVYKQDELGVITSINAGAIVGGGVKPALGVLDSSVLNSGGCNEFILHNSLLNIINTQSGVAYSVRSSDSRAEKQLINEVMQIVSSFNEKYKGLAVAELQKAVHMLPFEKSEDEMLIEVGKLAGEACGVSANVSHFHAGAETHIYANALNKNNQKFKPCLLGIADIYNMHSSEEKINYKSFIKGYEFLKEFFKVYNGKC